jgi:hypothetical protein
MLIKSKHSGFLRDGTRTPFFGGGGGGGGSQPAPVTQNVSNTNIPSYAQPYVENTLGQAAALTDINQNPYQTYGGQRIAEFSPLQQQAFSNVANQTTASQITPATGFSTAAGIGSLGVAGRMAGAGRDYQNMATNPYAMQSYMNPYVQASLQPQLNLLAQQGGIQSAQQQGAATQAGAFGGSRSALANALAQQNSLMAQQQAIGQGYNQAYQNAQQAQQFGANLGLQGYQGALAGLGQANQAAGTLGQLGQTQFGQQQQINQAQQTTGAVQQAQAQQALDQSYQDFLKQKNYPYQQLAFMSDMYRGLPLSQTANTIYQAPPNAASQLGGLGMSALGIYGMSGGFKADGGMVGKGYANGGLMAAKAYKEGGYAVGGQPMSGEAVIKQLTEMLDNPELTPQEVEAIQKKIMMYQRMLRNPETEEIMAPAIGRSGIASIGTGEMVPEQMAGGGIVAFAEGGQNKESYQSFLEDQVRNSIKEQLGGSSFSKSEAEKARLEQAIAARQERSPYEALAMAGLQTMAGTSQYGLSNLGLGAAEGLKSYSKSMGQDTSDRQKILEAQIYADKAEDARKAALTGQMQTTLGQMYNKQAAQAVAGASSEEKALLRVQALINQDDQLPLLYKQRDMYEPSDPKYKAYNDAINSIKSSYFEQVGIKRPFVAPAAVQFPEEKKEPGFFSRLLGGGSPAATKTPGVMRFDKNGNPV